TLSRTAACSFVTPWVEGLLPATRLAESGAQTIHGLDVVRDRLGHHIHPRGGDAGLDFIVDEAELIRRCERWLAVAGARHGALAMTEPPGEPVYLCCGQPVDVQRPDRFHRPCAGYAGCGPGQERRAERGRAEPDRLFGLGRLLGWCQRGSRLPEGGGEAVAASASEGSGSGVAAEQGGAGPMSRSLS